ncbi:LpqB family beta-propeller domain-containing protein [Cyanobium sp. WAJ14-Wanaka]|uniref:LpqB family beta-propeller domain-containing protein n=1 Tax=Cyanobium sp. WAJ14-Wanaka TaxID=2823725 RepID=UPI0020CDB196|nr:LpqB family beta-propeller domain-containing protein [Cyanobium sp. WAJ14-Wanaka]MCP9776123.1 Tol biopolymer transporter periplasmic protein [Cyanobium sp. WAJ14-Wanaka]
MVTALGLSGCDGSGWFSRRSAGPSGLLGAENRQEPALSGNGRFLASVVEQGGKQRVLLQEQPGGRIIPLRHLRGHEPQSSPSLSWNGRYIAAVVQQGQERVALIEDRATGNMVRIPVPAGSQPLKISLAADGRRLALGVMQAGQMRVQVLDLAGQLEADLPGGLAVETNSGAQAGAGAPP